MIKPLSEAHAKKRRQSPWRNMEPHKLWRQAGQTTLTGAHTDTLGKHMEWAAKTHWKRHTELVFFIINYYPNNWILILISSQKFTSNPYLIFKSTS